jgi:MoaA/NifB/PqqE/SkfB family radical SAM enzyme
MRPFHFEVHAIVDVELTNLCGANCSFCPRDATPHQGTMRPEIFAKALERVIEYRRQRDFAIALRGVEPTTQPAVSFCGLGDQVLNRHLSDYISAAHDSDLGVVVNTNAQRLDRTNSQALLDAGVDIVMVNGGEIGERYEEVYELPFEQTERNVRGFLDLAEDPKQLCITLVEHDHDPERVAAVRAHWEALGVHRFRHLELINRGGTLEHTHPDYATHPHAAAARRLLSADDALCAAPSLFPFIAYDGRYLLCGSDWEREVVLPTIFELSILEVLAHKDRVLMAGCDVCDGCNHHPHNRVADMVGAVHADEATPDELDELVTHLRDSSAFVRRTYEGLPEPSEPRRETANRRLIPVRVLDDDPVAVESVPSR